MALLGGKKGGGSSRHNGKALIEFSTSVEAQKAIQTLNGVELDGRALSLDGWTPKEGGKAKDAKLGNDANKVWISNVAWKTKGWKLKEHFSQAGNVVHYKQ